MFLSNSNLSSVHHPNSLSILLFICFEKQCVSCKHPHINTFVLISIYCVLTRTKPSLLFTSETIFNIAVTSSTTWSTSMSTILISTYNIISINITNCQRHVSSAFIRNLLHHVSHFVTSISTTIPASLLTSISTTPMSTSTNISKSITNRQSHFYRISC